VSDFLRQRYGRGCKVHHGRDVHWLDPTRYDGASLRRRWGLDRHKVVLWLGTPEPYKGLEDLAAAIVALKRDDLRLLLVGANPRDGLVRRVQQRLGSALVGVEMRPFAELPDFYAMADLVVLPQRRSPATVGQVPAKLFDAMAMAKPVISTAVSDIPQILEGCGMVVEPGHVGQLTAAMAQCLDDESRAAELGRRARDKCVREYSIEAMERTLHSIFSTYDPPGDQP
jgi:glycosyltransferase involved in cell wall biosynthesis